MSLPSATESFLTTLLVALYLPVPFYLLWIHGMHRLWTRVGPVAYVFHVSLYIAMVLAVFRAGDLWTSAALHVPVWIRSAAIVPLGAAAYLAVITYSTIDLKTLHQVRQTVSGEHRPLITNGILGTIRHPRYLMFSLIGAGNVIFSASLPVLISFLVCVSLFAIVIRVEERELRDHFGDEFLKYKSRVPAFIPRLWSK